MFVVTGLVVLGACRRQSATGATGSEPVIVTNPTARVTPVATLTEARASHVAVTMADTRVLIVGGFQKGPDGGDEVYSATTEVFDPRTNHVSPGPTMRQARAGHIAVALPGGAVLVAGGWGATGVQRTAELLDPTTHTWRDVGVLTTARADATASVLRDGRVVIIGGGDDTGTHATIDVFTPVWSEVEGRSATRGGTWTSGGSLRAGRSGHTATVADDGTIFIVGGYTRAGELVASIERYDPAAQSSTVVGALTQPRYKHATQMLDSGDLLVIGGSDTRDWKGKLRSTEIFEVATGTTWPGANLIDARFKLASAVVALGHDRFAVVGGAATVEVLMTNASERVASLPAAMQFGTATRVGARDVIVVGGYDESIRASADVLRISLDPPGNQGL